VLGGVGGLEIEFCGQEVVEIITIDQGQEANIWDINQQS